MVADVPYHPSSGAAGRRRTGSAHTDVRHVDEIKDNQASIDKISHLQQECSDSSVTINDVDRNRHAVAPSRLLTVLLPIRHSGRRPHLLVDRSPERAMSRATSGVRGLRHRWAGPRRRAPHISQIRCGAS